ncbi:MAG: hypothetical protein WD965_00845 [Actinomycetota bacterium]
MTLEDRTARPASEPLFTVARTSKAVPGPVATAADPWAPVEEEPEVRLSLVEALMDSMGGPVVELERSPIAFVPPAPVTPGPRHGRKGMVRNFRHWWRQESLARAAQKRVFAMAETILRSQAAQIASGPAGRAPAPGSQQAQSIRGMLELTEARFQALGLRSDRVQDELSRISRSLAEMRRQISELVALQRSR